jgi:DNA polymerase-3 subunit delta'
MSDAVCHPWNRPLWERMTADMERLSHGYLLAGPEGLGKRDFALALAKYLLCNQPTDDRQACGACNSCRLFEAANHPDLHIVQPDRYVLGQDSLMARVASRYLTEKARERKTPSSVISVDQVRALIQAVQTRAHQGQRKLVILAPAEAMNTNAANSLLKSLEEPTQDTVFLLVSPQPARLPATILSRCLRVDFPVPDPHAALQWLAAQAPGMEHLGLMLELSGGSPLKVLEQGDSDFLGTRQELIQLIEALGRPGGGDPVSAAARWIQLGSQAALSWLQGWVVDLIRVANVANPPRLFNPDQTERLHTTAKRLNLKKLYGFLEVISQARGQLDTPLDETLLLEDVLIQWIELNQGANP